MAGQNQQQFEEYFRRADLDRDGRISGAEAVAFFQGSGLSKQVLAQIWTHADQSRTGYLGRAEFYNALKLVTVAQSKRELTADIVKAALYGPASSKIPPPQINIAASPPSQLNSVNTVPVPQMGAVGATPSQSFGFRGQAPQSLSMNQQFFLPQGNQSARPPAPMSTSSASRPPLGVAGPDVSRTGGMVGPDISNSNISNKWFSGGPSGVPAGPTSQTPSRGISPSLSPVAPKPQDLPSASSLMAAKDPNASTTSGNGLVSNSIFGGDMFSATQSLPNQTSSTPKYSAGSSPASSAVVSTTTTNQPNAKPDPFESLHSSFAKQSAGGQPQQIPSFSNSNQQVSVQNSSSILSSGMPVQVGNSMPDQSQPPWPKMTRTGVQKYVKVFLEVDTDRDGRVTGDQARNLFLSWRLPREVLRQVWNLSDQDNDSMLSLREFCIALYLMERFKDGRSLPETLPSSILLDETLLSVAGLPTGAYGTAGWGPTPGWRPQHGMPGAQNMTPTGLRPPTQPLYPQGDGMMQSNQQKAREPSMEDSNTNQLSNGEQNALDSKSPETLEAEKKAEYKEKVILDSREKLEFYRSKMQDLVLYKSRCDNRLNEITERALADKHEAELLGKKYEEKYKQVAEMASKLTIEEASFRETQERKMELHQAIIKMEQGGSADGLLQVRADRIQSDLEELLRALTERCKKHGANVKSAALIELPPGWQPGIPEESAVWDEEWDKFEDAGFSFAVALNSNANPSALPNEISSPNANLSPDSLSNVDGKSERSFKVDHASEIESAYTHSEDELMKSPTGSPARHVAFDSPSKDSSDDHFRKSFEGTHRSFDEPTWGTFDNTEDADSVWGFGAKDSDHEKPGEKYFFGSPTKRDSPQADDVFQKKSPFFEDSVPSTPLSRAGNSPSRYSVSGDPFFDNLSRYDSFSTHDQRETLTRFDSVNSSRGFNHSQGFSFDDSDPFGSSGPFKVSSESPKKGSDHWSSF